MTHEKTADYLVGLRLEHRLVPELPAEGAARSPAGHPRRGLSHTGARRRAPGGSRTHWREDNRRATKVTKMKDGRTHRRRRQHCTDVGDTTTIAAQTHCSVVVRPDLDAVFGRDVSCMAIVSDARGERMHTGMRGCAATCGWLQVMPTMRQGDVRGAVGSPRFRRRIDSSRPCARLASLATFASTRRRSDHGLLDVRP